MTDTLLFVLVLGMILLALVIDLGAVLAWLRRRKLTSISQQDKFAHHELTTSVPSPFSQIRRHD